MSCRVWAQSLLSTVLQLYTFIAPKTIGSLRNAVDLVVFKFQNVRIALNFEETGCQGERPNAVIVTQREFVCFFIVTGSQ